MRAPAGGLLRTFKTTDDQVARGESLGFVSGPFGDAETQIAADTAGLIIGRSKLAAVNEGDAIFYIAKIAKSANPDETLEVLSNQLSGDVLFDEDKIV